MTLRDTRPLYYAYDGETLCPRCVAAGAATATDAVGIYEHEEQPDAGVTCDDCGEEIVAPIRLTIWRDDDAESPRDWDNLGRFYVPPGNRYLSGDKGAVPADSIGYPEIYASLPVYAYIHGGMTLSTVPFGCRWDSGQIGEIYVTRDGVAREYGDASDAHRETVLDRLHGEIETLKYFVGGDVYGFTVSRDGVTLESCGGFFGEDFTASGLANHLPDYARTLLDAGDYETE